MNGKVVSVHRSPTHSMGKPAELAIRLVAGLGIEGDAHAGEHVKHVARARKQPTLPNLRQVHLMHAELFEELEAKGFDVRPGELGENVVTRGLDLLALPEGTRLHLGAEAVVELTGLRNPCMQLDGVRPGLMNAVLERNERGVVVGRKAGVMSVVVAGGWVKAGDEVRVELPPAPHRSLPVV